MIKLESTKQKMLQNQKVAAAYTEKRPEFMVARALIDGRVKARMTQLDVAKRMHTSQSQVARLESGEHMPSFNSIHKYACAINRTIKIEIQGN